MFTSNSFYRRLALSLVILTACTQSGLLYAVPTAEAFSTASFFQSLSSLFGVEPATRAWNSVFSSAPPTAYVAQVAGTTGNTINAASCSQANVQSAINSASDGDTVLVPAGNCTWSSAVSISNKTITLAGAGSGTSGTVITYGGSGHSLLSINAGTKTGRMDVSGFRFVGGDTNYWDGNHIQFSGPYQWRNLRIHHNAFVDSVRWAVRGGSDVEGLIDNNLFTGNTFSMILSGRGDVTYTEPAGFGGPGFFFVEDNVFDVDDTYGSTGYPANDIENGGKMVLRHNTLRNAFVQEHDRCRNGLTTTRAMEVYGNTFAKDSDGWKAIDLSGGSAIIFDNTFEDFDSSAWSGWGKAIGAYDSREGTCDLPANEILGAVEPVYTWNNKRTNGTPVDTVECTSSAAACAEMTFATPGTPLPGYTPYTYPHPLRDGGTTPPPPPPSDTQAPTVSLTAPANGATVSGNTTVSANASDNVGVVGVQFKLDGVNLGSEDTTSPYSVSWNTTGASNGSHSLTAVARDAAGNTTTSAARSVTVSNTTTPPPSGTSETIWGSRTTTSFNSDSRPWDLGMIFTPTVAGQALGARVYGAPNESGAHEVRLWRNDGTLLSGPHTFTYAGTGWHEFTFPSAVALSANQAYTIVVSTGGDSADWYASVPSDLTSGGNNGKNLTYPANGAVYSDTVGVRPTQSYQSENYLRDIIFVAGDVPADTQAPSTPTNLTASAQSASSINLTWTPSTDNVGVTGYDLYRCQGTSCTPTTLVSSPTGTSYTDQGRSANTTYRYRIRAKDAAGNTSSYSSAVSATTQSAGTGAPAALPEGNSGIAAAYPGDAGISSNASVIYADDFESYSSASGLGASSKWNGGYYQGSNTRIATEAGNYYAGAKALEFTLPPTSNEVSNAVIKNLSQQEDVLFVRTYTKFDAGYDINTSSNHNGIRISAGTYPGPGNTPDGTDFGIYLLENGINYGEADPGYTRLYMYHPEQRHQWGDLLYPDGKVLPFDATLGNFGQYFVPRPNFIPERDRWYSYELMVKLNTPGQRDGRAAIWIDGNLVADFQNLRQRDVNTLRINQVQLELHSQVGGSSRNNKKWYDNVVIARSYIGPMTTGTTPPPTPTPTASLTASPSSITSGQSTTLTWSSTDATSCLGTGFSTGGSTSGSVSVSPTSNATYTLACTGAGGSDIATAVVSVTPLLTVSASAVPPSGVAPLTTFFNGSAAGGTGEYTYAWVFGDGSTVSTEQNPSHTYSAAGTYTATMTVVSGTQTKNTDVVVTVTAPTPPTASLTASPSSITSGQSTTLTWSSTDATSCIGTGFTTGGATSGTVSVSPTSDTTYSIACTGSGGSDTDSASVTVNSTPPPTGDEETLWGNSTPSSSETQDSTSYELGTIFGVTTDGTITGIRVYAADGETGSHTARLWSGTTLVGGPYTFNATGPGWVTYTLPTPIPATAGGTYTVSVTTGSDSGRAYVYTLNALTTAGDNDAHLTYPANAGVYATTLGTRPTQSWNAANYYRDVVFVAGDGDTTPSEGAIFEDDFEEGLDWQRGDDVTWYTGSPKNGTRSVRLRRFGTIEQQIPLTGYENIVVSFALGANSLDRDSEYVYAEYYNGTEWVEFVRIANNSSNEDNQLHDYTTALPATVDNLSSFALRFGIAGSGLRDYAYVDDVRVASDNTPVQSFSTQRAPAIVDDAVLLLSFNEGSGAIAGDTSPYGNNGTVAGAQWTTGKSGAGLSFDGVNDTVMIADNASLDLTTGMTLEAWVYPTALSGGTSNGWRTVLLKERSGGLAYALYANDQNSVPTGYVNIGGDRDVDGAAQLPVNTWSHVASTYDGSVMRMYVNGVQVGTALQTGVITTSNGQLKIGGNSVWGEHFQGVLDEIRVYDYARTQEDILGNMNSFIGL